MSLVFCRHHIIPVKKGIVDKNPKNVQYLNAFEEERYTIAQANTEVDHQQINWTCNLPIS